MYKSKRIIAYAGIFMMLIYAAVIKCGVVAAAQTSGGFSVRAVISDNQVDKRQTYFDLKMKPGEEQTVEIVIDNSRDEEFIADIRLNSASTGRNGLIAYTVPDVRDESMKVSVTDIAELQSESVTVSPHGSKTVAVKIKMPDEPIDGVILGGIAVTGRDAEDDAQTAQGVSLTNKITYVIALKLTESDIVPEADFDLAAITPGLVNYKTAVTAVLQNKAARIVKGMEIKAEVFRKGSDTVLYELEKKDAEMAPLSRGNFVIDWGNRPIDRGTYRLKMTAVYDGRTWEWDEEFTIGTESGQINNDAVGLIKDYTWFYIFIGAAVLSVVWFIAYYLGRRRKPDEGARA